jgi:hypothetical protein
LVRDWREHPHTRVDVDVEAMIHRAVELNAFLDDVPYARYERHRAKRHVTSGDHGVSARLQ